MLCTWNRKFSSASSGTEIDTVAMLLDGLCTNCDKIKKINAFSKCNTGFVTILFTCTTGVPKFSGSVRGRWSRVWKENKKQCIVKKSTCVYNSSQVMQLQNIHAGIRIYSFNAHLAFVEMSPPFQTQRSPSQCSFIAIIKNLKRSKHRCD